MHGIPKAMFMPLSLAAGFAMIASFLYPKTFVPVVARTGYCDHLHTMLILPSPGGCEAAL